MKHLDLRSLPALRALRVRDIMTRTPVTIDHQCHVSEAMDLMDRRGIRHLPVLRAGKLAGLLSERHVRDAMPSVLMLRDPAARRKSLAVARVCEVWIENPATIDSDAGLLEAIQVMRRLRAGSLPVVDRGVLVGILTSGDLIELLTRVLETRDA